MSKKTLGIKIKAATATTKPEFTTTTKNNDRGINDQYATRETDLQ